VLHSLRSALLLAGEAGTFGGYERLDVGGLYQ
jgi:hypothetical protein